uniref:Uncharacterized protein n=1 Tax=Aegilops tauschii TaxID=37682 RepID=M8C7Z3_AEGTA
MASAAARVLLLVRAVASFLAGRTDALRSLGVGDEAGAGAATQGDDAVDLNPTSLDAFLTASREQFAFIEFFAHCRGQGLHGQSRRMVLASDERRLFDIGTEEEDGHGRRRTEHLSSSSSPMVLFVLQMSPSMKRQHLLGDGGGGACVRLRLQPPLRISRPKKVGSAKT